MRDFMRGEGFIESLLTIIQPVINWVIAIDIVFAGVEYCIMVPTRNIAGHRQ